MAETTGARKAEYLRETLIIVNDAAEDGIRPRDLFPKLNDRLNLSGIELESYPAQPGIPRFQTIVRFLTIRAAKAGWLVKKSGYWYITPLGTGALQKFPTPASLNDAVAFAYKEWKSATSSSDAIGGSDDAQVDPVDLTAEIEFENAQDLALAGILSYLKLMTEYRFQDMVGALLNAMGYHVIWNAPPGPDHGVDIIAFPDALGVQSPRIKVQVKHGGDPIPRPTIQSFFGTLGADDVGLFVARGGFTKDCGNEARHHPTVRVTLIDAYLFTKLWQEHYPRMTEEQKSFMRLEQISFVSTSAS